MLFCLHCCDTALLNWDELLLHSLASTTVDLVLILWPTSAPSSSPHSEAIVYVGLGLHEKSPFATRTPLAPLNHLVRGRKQRRAWL